MQQPIQDMKQKPLAGLQLLRGLAAVLVVFHHAARKILDATGSEPHASLYQIGSRGVELFFVLSGFIILYAHIRDDHTLGAATRYCAKRLLRILPLCLLISSAIIVPELLLKGQDPIHLARIWLSSALVLPMLEYPSPIVIWSLRHELLFYLIFLLFYIRPAIGLAAIPAWGIISYLVSPPESEQFYFALFSNYNILFTFGIASFYLFRRDDRIWRHPAAPWLCGFLFLALTWMTQGVSTHTSLVALAFGPLAMMLILSCARLPLAGQAGAFAKLLGDASFSIYMVHYPVVSAICHFGMKFSPSGDLIYGLASIAGIVAGIICYILIERPVQRRTSAWIPARPQPTRRPAGAGRPLADEAIENAAGALKG